MIHHDVKFDTNVLGHVNIHHFTGDPALSIMDLLDKIKMGDLIKYPVTGGVGLEQEKYKDASLLDLLKVCIVPINPIDSRHGYAKFDTNVLGHVNIDHFRVDPALSIMDLLDKIKLGPFVKYPVTGIVGLHPDASLLDLLKACVIPIESIDD